MLTWCSQWAQGQGHSSWHLGRETAEEAVVQPSLGGSEVRGERDGAGLPMHLSKKGQTTNGFIK